MTNITKTVLPSNDVYIQFTEDELQELNMKPGDKFTVKQNDDGSVLFQKKVPIEIDLDEFPEHILRNLVKESLDKDIPVGDIIENALANYLDVSSHDENYDESTPIEL
jgi:hypothetical protein